MKKLLIPIIVLFLILTLSVYAENTFLPFSARVNLNNREHNGNFTANIYDSLTGGTLVYNETFNDSISGGRARAILGNQNVALDLVGGRVYYLELFIDQTRNMSFTVNGTSQRRMPFVAPIQIDHNVNITNITVNGREDNSVILRGGMQIDNFFNISRTTSSVRTNGTLTILSLLSPALSIRGFNISGSNAALSTNGSILVNNLFNVTGSTGNTEIGGTLDVDGAVTLNSRASPAFSVNNGFNISGANSALNTNGSILVNNLFNVTAATGNTEIGGTLDVDGNSVFQGKLYSVGDFNVSSLFNVTASSGALRIGGVLTALNNVIVNNFFNITTFDSQIRTNGTLTIRSTDSDDALNVTGGVKMLQNVTVNHNVTAANYYGNGGTLSGIVSNNDGNWQFISWQNFSSRKAGLNVTNFTDNNVHRVDFMIWNEDKRCDDNPGTARSAGIYLRVNNNSQNGHRTLIRDLGTSDFTQQVSANEFNLSWHTTDPTSVTSIVGSLYFLQMDSILISQDSGLSKKINVYGYIFPYNPISNTTAIILHEGAFETSPPNKLSDLSFYADRGGIAQQQGNECGTLNGTVKIYARNFFDNY